MTTVIVNVTSDLKDVLHGKKLFGFICLGLLVILTACGNVIICVAILKNRHLRTSSNLLIINMAFGDILYSVSTLPLSMVLMCSRGSEWPLGRAGNVFFDAVWLLFFVLSFLNVQVIALNRFVAITKPYAYKIAATKKRTVGLCVCIWVYVTMLVFGLSFSFKETNGRAYAFLIPGRIYYTILIFHAVFTFVSVPLLYIIIFLIAKKHKLEIIKQKDSHAHVKKLLS
ncbi:histamine H2 receptor-like [Dendronephthya gigantea]|uniref:histamine H2 receptor-like n=1 Tax=Dendronephthya gigantea TaxID=151771 RepID=UPI00106CDDFE|nr:histamine H2 receptor-like [Dendronephthya gigantea]